MSMPLSVDNGCIKSNVRRFTKSAAGSELVIIVGPLLQPTSNANKKIVVIDENRRRKICLSNAPRLFLLIFIYSIVAEKTHLYKKIRNIAIHDGHRIGSCEPCDYSISYRCDFNNSAQVNTTMFARRVTCSRHSVSRADGDSL